jgi:N-acetylneuraminic acid mutarotase
MAMTLTLRSSRAFVMLVALSAFAAVAPALANHFILPCGDDCVAHWVAAADMQDPREGHTATRLPDGTVLVVGGWTSAGAPLASVEIYNPATNAWRRAANLLVPRAGHTATLLVNGKVLVTGGSSASAFLSSAELYDMSNDTWSPAASMAVPRRNHTATLLSNGKVLVAAGGGCGSCGSYGYTNSAELYDAAIDTWTPAASLALPHADHTATLMADGRVLVAGGSISFPGENPQDTEMYDPVSDIWSSAGTILGEPIDPRYSSATLLPDGKVLLAGGGDATDWVLDGNFLYDPATNSWSAGGNLETFRELHSATMLPSGEVLIAGGFNYSDVAASSELYDPATGTSKIGSNLVIPRAAHTATLLPNGMVLVTGGVNLDRVLSSTELYVTTLQRAAPDVASGD